MVREVRSAEEFESLVKSNSLVIFDFWAPWCGPCRIIAPIFEKVASEYKDVEFAKVNVDELPEIAARFSVSSIPTLVAVYKGRIVNHAMGALPEPMLKEFVESSKSEIANG